MKLKFQRRLFVLAASALLATTAAASLWAMQASAEEDVVPLGKGMASVNAVPASVPVDETEIGEGEASYYADRFAGRPTANGEPFNPEAMTAAHRTLPFGSKVRVTNTLTDESVVVRINDRGPYAAGRVIDLSKAAAREIGMLRAGVARVRLALIV